MSEAGNTNRPGHRILRISKEQFEAKAEARRASGDGKIGKRIMQRRDQVTAQQNLDKAKQRIADRLAAEAAARSRAAATVAKTPGKGTKAAPPAPTPPPATPPGTLADGEGETSMRDVITAVRAKDSELGPLLVAELARPEPRRRVLETLADEFDARKEPMPATLEEALGALLDPPPA